MYLGYNIETIYGWAPRYSDEFNVPSSALPESWMSIKTPSASFISDGSTTLVFPVSHISGMVKVADGSAIPISDIEMGAVAPSIHIMGAISENEIPAGATIAVVTIGLVPIVAVLICLAIISVAGVVYYTSRVYTNAWIQAHYYEAQEAYYDYLVQAQKVISDIKTDINTDGVLDVETITWANGRSMSIALSDYGATYLGGNTKINDPGTVVEPPIEPPGACDGLDIMVACIPWITVYVVGGLVLLVVLGPKIVEIFRGKDSKG